MKLKTDYEIALGESGELWLEFMLQIMEERFGYRLPTPIENYLRQKSYDYGIELKGNPYDMLNYLVDFYHNGKYGKISKMTFFDEESGYYIESL